MSKKIAVPAAARGAMAAAYGGWLVDGPGDPALLIFTNARPADGAAAGASPAVTILLAKPTGELVSNKWRLAMKNTGGYQAVAGGTPTWGRLITASGLWAGDGDAGGPTDDVAFRLQGGALFAGGYVLLATVLLG